MLYDGCAGLETAVGGCGSWWAPGIMTSVNLHYRTVSLMGLHVNWRRRINSVCNTELSPAAFSWNLPLTVHCILTLLPLLFWRCFWSHEQPMGKMRQHFSLPELTEQLKIVAFILVKDWFEVVCRSLSAVLCPPSQDDGAPSGCGAGVEHAVSSCCTLTALASGVSVSARGEAADLLWGSQIPQARQGSLIPEAALPSLPSTYFHPGPSSYITRHSLSNLTDSCLAEAWHSVYTAPNPPTQALSIKRHWRGTLRCIWTRGWWFQPCRLQRGENPGFAPQPRGSATCPLDEACGLSYIDAVRCCETVAVGWFSLWQRQIEETDFDNVKKEIRFLPFCVSREADKMTVSSRGVTVCLHRHNSLLQDVRTIIDFSFYNTLRKKLLCSQNALVKHNCILAAPVWA